MYLIDYYNAVTLALEVFLILILATVHFESKFSRKEYRKPSNAGAYGIKPEQIFSAMGEEQKFEDNKKYKGII